METVLRREKHKDIILIVDDKPENLYALKSMLSEDDREIVEASSGQEALMLAYKYDFSLILLDVQMPEMDGFEVAKMLKSTRRTKKVPIIFVTAISKERKYLLQGLEDGAVDYLFKPLDVGITLAKVKTWLRFFHQQHELEILNQQLAVLNDQKNYFLGMASHDLRNPIGNIINLVQFIQSEGENLSEEHKSFLNTITESGNYMLNLLNDLLDISKIESGKMELRMAEMDMQHLINTVISDNSFSAGKKQIGIKSEICSEMPVIHADTDQLRQVLNNLVSNAIKYSANNTSINICVEKVNNEVVVAVHDQGQGIPSEELGQIFSPFKKTSVKATAGESSTGLGLAIVKKVVEAHHGRVWVTSEQGKGSVFSFSIPVRMLKAA